jgi:hypothetical protein
MALLCPRCPMCGLPCCATHNHYSGKDDELHRCGCIKGHRWFSGTKEMEVSNTH